MKLGVFSRPWNQFDLAESLASIRESGFTSCGMMRHKLKGDKLEYVIHGGLTDNEIEQLQELFDKQQLELVTHFAFVDLWNDDGADKFKREIDVAHKLGEKYLLTTGASEEHRDRYLEIMKSVLDYAEEKQVLVTVKPHGGITNTVEDCLNIINELAHDNFRIFYDPGNIIHYTGDDPTRDLEKLAPYVCGICVKDCQGGLQGDVNILPGEGKVDWLKVFRILTDHGFDGPCLIECLGGDSFAAVNKRAAKALLLFQDFE